MQKSELWAPKKITIRKDEDFNVVNSVAKHGVQQLQAKFLRRPDTYIRWLRATGAQLPHPSLLQGWRVQCPALAMEFQTCGRERASTRNMGRWSGIPSFKFPFPSDSHKTAPTSRRSLDTADMQLACLITRKKKPALVYPARMQPFTRRHQPPRACLNSSALRPPLDATWSATAHAMASTAGCSREGTERDGRKECEV
ncbi:hypothetical protein B0H17DRAFT_1128313 [Mycena rosella]|uniref:Uncharacterized protein n=1 Tax=Mycena rosella TaxID=1033263 RepID=A0AAD7DWM3_MYCRO|nr:hypothetical protein B0H17DRAFT_1128313 [Mycena rosella]